MWRWPLPWRTRRAPAAEPPVVWEAVEPTLTDAPDAAARAARALATLADAPEPGAPDWPSPWAPHDTPATPAGADDDILMLLHQEYLASLRDPLHGLAALPPSGEEPGTRSDPAEAFDHWRACARKHASLYAVMGEADAIEPVLAALDSGLPSARLEAEPEDDVLRLFAPAELRPAPSPQDSWLALVAANPTAAPDAPPELNRREHHAITLDSGLPLPSTQPRN